MLQGSYPLDCASDREICVDVSGLEFPQSGLLWYLSPYCVIHTVDVFSVELDHPAFDPEHPAPNIPPPDPVPPPPLPADCDEAVFKL